MCRGSTECGQLSGLTAVGHMRKSLDEIDPMIADYSTATCHQRAGIIRYGQDSAQRRLSMREQVYGDVKQALSCTFQAYHGL